MAKVLELSEETYHQLADLAERQRRPVEDMLRLCLETCRHHRLFTRSAHGRSHAADPT